GRCRGCCSSSASTREPGVPAASRKRCQRRARRGSCGEWAATATPWPRTRPSNLVCRLSADDKKQANAGKFSEMRVLRRSDGRRLPVGAMAQLRAASATRLREQAKAARRRAALLLPLVVGVILVNRYRENLFHVDEPVRLACAFALVGLGAWFARDLGRAIGPGMTKRMDQGTAGTIGFLVRLVLLIAATVLALHIAGL